VLPSDGDPLDAVLDEVWAVPQGESRFVSVVVPELFRKPSLASALLHRSTFSLKLGLLREPGVAVTDVPKLADDETLPSRAQVVVPVSSMNAASLRALQYARSLGLPDTKAVYFADHEEEAEELRRDWRQFPTGIPLEIVDAPYRDVGQPLLAYLREITADPEAVAVVVMPEVVVRGTDRLLHNQRALPEAAAAVRASGDPHVGAVPADLVARTRRSAAEARRRAL
jgi:hypothetical protein